MQVAVGGVEQDALVRAEHDGTGDVFAGDVFPEDFGFALGFLDGEEPAAEVEEDPPGLIDRRAQAQGDGLVFGDRLLGKGPEELFGPRRPGARGAADGGGRIGAGLGRRGATFAGLGRRGRGGLARSGRGGGPRGRRLRLRGPRRLRRRRGRPLRRGRRRVDHRRGGGRSGLTRGRGRGGGAAIRDGGPAAGCAGPAGSPAAGPVAPAAPLAAADRRRGRQGECPAGMAARREARRGCPAAPGVPACGSAGLLRPGAGLLWPGARLLRWRPGPAAGRCCAGGIVGCCGQGPGCCCGGIPCWPGQGPGCCGMAGCWGHGPGACAGGMPPWAGQVAGCCGQTPGCCAGGIPCGGTPGWPGHTGPCAGGYPLAGPPGWLGHGPWGAGPWAGGTKPTSRKRPIACRPHWGQLYGWVGR